MEPDSTDPSTAAAAEALDDLGSKLDAATGGEMPVEPGCVPAEHVVSRLKFS